VTEEATNLRSVKIGELLIGVGALTSGDLTEAIQIAKRIGVPIGRVLVMSGCVTEDKLQQALELQSLVKDGLCDLDVGMKALRKVFKEDKDLQTSLKELNWAPKQDANSNKLGEILIDSNIVSRGQLERALEASFQSGMPLGGTLVLQGVLSAQLLPTILHTQEQIRDNKVSRDEAVDALKQALMFWAKADQSKDQKLLGNERAQPKTGDKSTSSATNLPSDAARTTKRAGASPAQSGTKYSGVDKEATGPTPGKMPTTDSNDVSLIELLKLSGYCTQASLSAALVEALRDSRLAAKLLLAIGFIDAATLNAYIYCQALIAKGTLRTDQSLYILNAMRNRNLSLEQALAELGIPSSALP
jgi:hypothetical protein